MTKWSRFDYPQVRFYREIMSGMEYALGCHFDENTPVSMGVRFGLYFTQSSIYLNEIFREASLPYFASKQVCRVGIYAAIAQICRPECARDANFLY